MSGFYLMHRGWRDNPALKDTYSRGDAWVWLIEAAAFKETKVGVAGKTIVLARGQLSHSLRFMAAQWGWDEAKVRRFLSRLQREEMIRSVTDAGQTVITICNYDKYQIASCVTDAPTDAASTQHRRGGDANKKEGNEGKEDSPLNPPKGGKRGSKISPDWKPNGHAKDIAKEEGYSDSELDRLIAGFREYWAGTGKTKVDWDQTFYNHLRSAIAHRDVAAWRRNGVTGETGRELTPQEREIRARLEREHGGKLI